MKERAVEPMKAEHINPFILSVCKVVKDMCMMDLQIGKPVMKKETYSDDSSIIKLGLVGALTGTVVLNLEHSTALGIISKMMMMPMQTIDEIGQSAISELGNMIAGNAATVFASNDILIDITPPSYCLGKDYQGDDNEMFSIPFTSEAGPISVDIYIQE
jgi:chemotaxis protein CheX